MLSDCTNEVWRNCTVIIVLILKLKFISSSVTWLYKWSVKKMYSNNTHKQAMANAITAGNDDKEN